MNRVLIFNFFGGVMHRGIPLYAQDIAESMRRVGLEPIELRCPGFLRRAPRPVKNVTFVLFEQIVAPLARFFLRCRVAVYPYNSGGIVDALLGRSILVVHDLISNDLANRSLAARYIRVTQAFHRAFRRPVCAASGLTLSHLRRLNAFRGCSLQLWSNPFYSFEAALAHHGHVTAPAPRKRPRVLLCSGMGPNKDYGGAIKLFAKSHVLADAELHVIGFGHDAPLARRRLARLPQSVAERITVHPGMRLDALVAEYLAADLIWVHSRGEGFGRCVVEARLSARPVVASDISAFRKQRARGVYLYADAEFEKAVGQALSAGAAEPLSAIAYHAPLEAAVAELVGLYTHLTLPAPAEVPEPAAEVPIAETSIDRAA
jgi:glycosyltransferase involved in cell wall biosynthesis